MSREAALSISDLLSVLREILDLESLSKLREISLPLTSSASSLQSEINSLEARAQDISRLIPSLREIAQPVNRLPPEILSHIARYLIKDHDEDATSIVPLTHVCRYWRESMTSTPANWTLISSKNKHMAAVSLERAKAAPLEITLWMPLDPSFPNIFAPHFQTTRTLAVHRISTIEELTNVFPNFPQSMPTLRSLELVNHGSTDWDQSTDPFRSFVPALECLSLTGIPLYPSLLGLGTLTEFSIKDHRFSLHLDTLLDFLEGNKPLERVTLDIYFTQVSFLGSNRKNAMRNQIRCLFIDCLDAGDAKALLSRIPLQRGADLRINLSAGAAALSTFLPDISAAHLSNPPSPTCFQLAHSSHAKHIKLEGSGGKLSFHGLTWREASFADFAVLPLANVREVRIHYRKGTTLEPPIFNPSYFPALETLTIDCNANVPTVLSVLLSNSPLSPSLKTIGFLNCDLSEIFMEKLTKFASERRNIPTLTRLHRVQIINGEGEFPSAASIRRLREYVNVVEARIEDEFSADLV